MAATQAIALPLQLVEAVELDRARAAVQRQHERETEPDLGGGDDHENAAENWPASDAGVTKREMATRLRLTAFVMSSSDMSTMTALFFDSAPNSPMQNSTAASAMNAVESDGHHWSPPDHHTAPTSAMSRTTEAISNGSAHPEKSSAPNSATPGVTAGSVGTGGANDAIAVPAATSTASAMPPAAHDRSRDRIASSRWRSVSMTMNSSSTDDRARVDHHLHEREELGGQQQEEAGDGDHDLEHPERGVHDVAREHDHRGADDRGDGEHEERDRGALDSGIRLPPSLARCRACDVGRVRRRSSSTPRRGRQACPWSRARTRGSSRWRRTGTPPTHRPHIMHAPTS